MTLKSISNNELILRMEKLVRTERKITHLVLLHIAEIEGRKLYAELGYDGMYAYLTRGLGYSEGSAYRRLQSARLLKQVPSVAQKIEEGHLNLTQLTQVQKCLKDSVKTGGKVSREKTLDVLSKLENKNSWETQKTLALEMNLPVVIHEQIQPQKDNSVRLEVTLTQEQFEELEKAKSLLSHVCPEGSWSEVISILAKSFNHKKLQGRSKVTRSAIATGTGAELEVSSAPKSTAASRERSASGSTLTSALTPHLAPTSASASIQRPSPFPNAASVQTPITIQKASKPRRDHQMLSAATPRKYISIHHKRFLLKNAHNCCEYQNPQTGRKCNSRYQLEIDHRQPLALGGTDDLSNLRILCRTHNAMAAKQAGLKQRRQY